MRTTVILDRDVAHLLEAFRRKRRINFRAAITGVSALV